MVALLAGALATSGAAADPLVEPRNVGGGLTLGSLSYSPAMPRVGTACQPDLAISLGGGWASRSFVFNTVISGFAGDVTITGGGTSGCENYTLGQGELSLAVEGFNPVTESRLDCRDGDPTGNASNLRGTYTRVLSHMTLILTGDCVVNQFATSKVMFLAQVEVVPLTPGAGVQTSLQSAAAIGAFVIIPV